MKTPPRRNGTGLVAALASAGALLLLTGFYLWGIGAQLGPAGVIGGPFELVRGDGQPVTDRSLQGKYLLIYFGYTHCDDVCPTTLTAVAEALEALGPRAGQLQPVFITVDPVRDTPAVVASYVAGFTPRLLGLTGSVEAIGRVARQYHVSSAPTHAEPGDAGRIDHSSVLYLVGRDGRYLAPIRAGSSGRQMARELVPYLS